MELSLAPGAGGTIESAADLDHYLGSVAKAGFPCVSLGWQQVAAVAEGPDGLGEVASLVAGHGLRCHDVLSLTVRRDEEATLAQAAQLASLARAVEAEWVLCLLFTRYSDEAVDRLARCADVIAEAGARVAFEFVPGGAVGTIEEADRLVSAVGADRVGIMIDTWHFFRGASTWEQLEQVPLDRLAYVQFDDALAPESDDVLSESVNRRTWPGQGEFELERFTRTLRDRGWSGLVSVEVLSAELRELELGEYTRLAHDTTRSYWE